MDLLWWGVGGALIGAIIGKHFRRQAGVGAVLGLLLGPLGWILVYTIRDLRYKCPECRSPVPEQAKRCPKCGSEINPSIFASETPRGPRGPSVTKPQIVWAMIGLVLFILVLVVGLM